VLWVTRKKKKNPRLIKEIVETKKIPQEIDVFQSIHMQIAFLMARSPETREMYSLIHEVALAEHMKATRILETAPEVVKEYFARTGKETLDVTIKKDYLVGSIVKIAAQNCEWLKTRNWMVAEAPENFHFVTSDSPITFKDIDPRLRGKYGPGLRHKHSRIFFPLTPKFALVGEFNDELPEYLVLTEKQAAIMNTQVVERPYSQIYSSQPDFKWFIPKGQVGNFDDFKSHRRSPEIDKLFRSYHKDKKEKKTEVIKTLLHDRFDPKTFNFKKNGGNTPEDFMREL
jgi:hypothetical protein